MTKMPGTTPAQGTNGTTTTSQRAESQALPTEVTGTINETITPTSGATGTIVYNAAPGIAQAPQPVTTVTKSVMSTKGGPEVGSQPGAIYTSTGQETPPAPIAKATSQPAAQPTASAAKTISAPSKMLPLPSQDPLSSLESTQIANAYAQGNPQAQQAIAGALTQNYAQQQVQNQVALNQYNQILSEFGPSLSAADKAALWNSIIGSLYEVPLGEAISYAQGYLPSGNLPSQIASAGAGNPYTAELVSAYNAAQQAQQQPSPFAAVAGPLVGREAPVAAAPTPVVDTSGATQFVSLLPFMVQGQG